MTDHLIQLWKVTSRSGETVRVANFEEDVTFESEVYTGVSMDTTEVQVASGLSADNAEITIPLVAPFTLLKLLGGYWRGARVVLQVVDFTNLGAPAEIKRTGHIGEVGINNLVVTPQFRSLSQLLNQPIGDVYAATCRHILGDEGCKKNLAAFTFNGTVTAVTDNQQFTVSVVQANNYFHKGRITFTSGDNDDLTEEIWQNTAGALVLFRPMVGAVAVGNNVTLIAGDDKDISTCITKFNNAINFGGVPYLPGRTKTFSFPST